MTFYVVMMVKKWDTLEPEEPRLYPPISVKPPEGCCGFLFVYDDLEAAERDHPNAQIQVCTGATP